MGSCFPKEILSDGDSRISYFVFPKKCGGLDSMPVNFAYIQTKKKLDELLINAEALLEATKSDSFSPENPRGIAYYNLQATVRRIRNAQQTQGTLSNQKGEDRRQTATPGINQETEGGPEPTKPEETRIEHAGNRPIKSTPHVRSEIPKRYTEST